MKQTEEGRCFHCGGAYHYGHKCPDKNLRVMIYRENEEDWVEGTSQPRGSKEDMEELENESHEDKECNHMNLYVLLAGGMT